jgi:hypothetical protein
MGNKARRIHASHLHGFSRITILLMAFGSNAGAHDQPSEKAAAALGLWPQNPRPNS